MKCDTFELCLHKYSVGINHNQGNKNDSICIEIDRETWKWCSIINRNMQAPNVEYPSEKHKLGKIISKTVNIRKSTKLTKNKG